MPIFSRPRRHKLLLDPRRMPGPRLEIVPTRPRRLALPSPERDTPTRWPRLLTMLLPTLMLMLLLAVLLVPMPGCGASAAPESESQPASRALPESPATAERAAETEPAAGTAAPRCGERVELAPGLVWQTKVAPIAPPLEAGDRCIRLLRIDPAHFELRVLTAFEHGEARGAPTWARDFGLTAAINTSMYRPSGRSTGILIHSGTVQNGKDTKKFGAFLAFDPAVEANEPSAPRPAVAMFGRGCPDYDLAGIRAGYRSLVQNYRLLDCDGKAIDWKDPKMYSAAAVALDRQGHVVFLHVRTPYLMRDLTRMLTDPDLDLGLTAAMFVEGGPEASLHVRHGDFEQTWVGSYESGFQEHDDNRVSWPLPNVIGVVPRSKG